MVNVCLGTLLGMVAWTGLLPWLLVILLAGALAGAGWWHLRYKKAVEHRLDQAVQARTQALERNNQLLRAGNKGLEQFIYVVSHNLQQPLVRITGFSRLLQQKYAPAIDEKGRQYFRYMESASDELDTLLRAYLRYSHIGKRTDYTWIDSTALVQELGKELIDNLQIGTCHFQVEALSSLHMVPYDCEMLFTQLIQNALVYHKPGEPPEVRIGMVQGAAEPCFYIRDNGIGIEPGHQQRIFNLFQRLHKQEDYPGVGVGLPLCRKVVQRYGGRIWVNAIPKAGSVFYFTLPQAMGKPQVEKD